MLNSSTLPPLHPNTFKNTIAKNIPIKNQTNYLPTNYSHKLLNTILKDELKNTPKLINSFALAFPYFILFLISLLVFSKVISYAPPKDTTNEVEIVEENNKIINLDKHSVFLRNSSNINQHVIVKVSKVPKPSSDAYHFISFSHCASVEITRANTPNVSNVRLTSFAMQSKFELNGTLVNFIDVPIHTNVFMIPEFNTQEQIFVWKSFVDTQPLKA
jgi:hypothetical protein